MKIEIHTEVKNPICHMAKQWLDINNYTYTEVEYDNPHIIQGFYESLDMEVNSLPQVFIDDEHIGGFDQLLRSKLV
jgi:glutaredoxin